MTRPRPPPPAPAGEAARAAAASRRLDDAFRGYLGERGAKPVPLADVTRLVTGAAGLRLAADAVIDLWSSDESHRADRAGVRRELTVDAARRLQAMLARPAGKAVASDALR